MPDEATTSTLDYASTGANRPRPPSTDAAMITLAIGQIAFALMFGFNMIAHPSAGSDELKRFRSARLPAEEAGWVCHLAWRMNSPVEPLPVVAWLIASITMAVGAISLNPPLRRRCYRIGGGIVVTALALMLLSLLLLDSAGISYRGYTTRPVNAASGALSSLSRSGTGSSS